jgi:hypothetical protein
MTLQADRLSPRTRRGLFHHLIAQDDQAAIDRRHKAEAPQVKQIVRYGCPVCDDEHDFEDDAAECCLKDQHFEDGPQACPVCGQDHTSPREASDCCLWKDLDAATRWRLADRVEAGETWAEVLSPALS